MGITLDYSLAIARPNLPTPPGRGKQNARMVLFSSHLTFNDDVSSITDGQLTQMALDAYNEIAGARTQYGLNRDTQPGALSVMAFDKEIILASSQKGKTSFTYEMTQTDVLNPCSFAKSSIRKTGLILSIKPSSIGIGGHVARLCPPTCTCSLIARLYERKV